MSSEPASSGAVPPAPGAFERRVGRALAALLSERGRDPAVVEQRLGLPRGSVSGLLRGESHLDLATLQRVLAALDVDPGGFLSGLYAGESLDDPGAESGAPPALDREEIDALIQRINTTVRGLVRVLGARAEADDVRR